jgi:hypothetical protein
MTPLALGPLEPPARFVAFVERHLTSLRRDAALVVGAGHDPDEIYPEVLTTVASRWPWLELAERHLHRPDLFDAFLRRAFTRQALYWRRTQLWPVEVDVWLSDVPPSLEIEVSGGSQPAAGSAASLPAPRTPSPASRLWPGRPGLRSSAATRLAPYLVPAGATSIRPVVEATLAWLHARAARQRHRRIAGLVAFGVLFGVILCARHAMGAAG